MSRRPPRAEADPMPWDMRALSSAPPVFADPAHSTEEVKAVFYEGMPWKGRPTRVFAYYGVPPANGQEKVPAMVLVHGGGGSAFIPWVRLWMSRGYAAIAMDTCGAVSSGRQGFDAWADFKSLAPVVRAELNYTVDTGAWPARNWATVPAVLDTAGGRMSARLPPGTTVYYFNLVDARDRVVSSEHEALAEERKRDGLRLTGPEDGLNLG